MSRKERWYKRFWNFLREARAELKKVTWPSREEVMATTVVVIASIVFFGFFLFFCDIAFSWAISQIKALIG
jgi:preprotein translocase subunit SecE